MRRLSFLILGLAASLPGFAAITQSHGYAQFGTLKYPANFQHFDWTNPDAPKGGTLRLMASGSFDTLNPYTLKGTSPIGTGDFLQYGVNELNEPLMVGTGLYDPSGDEAASSYGLIAKSVEYAEKPQLGGIQPAPGGTLPRRQADHRQRRGLFLPHPGQAGTSDVPHLSAGGETGRHP
ncbi:putative solute-binding protein [Pseudomonas aeruginosa]|nr:putative solute-binding protein [Pseudomonas aeruginosa]